MLCWRLRQTAFAIRSSLEQTMGRLMMILGIDTASPSCSAALVEANQTIACSRIPGQSAASSHLLRLVDDLCTQAGCVVTDLAGVAVNLGPGAFTGLRVGLATAQGLVTASRRPLASCNTFEALVDAATDWEGPICPVIEARRGEVYAAFYRRQDRQACEIMPGMAVTPDALCDLVRERTLFLGSGVQSYKELLASRLGIRAVCRDLGSDFVLAAHVARLGCERLATAALDLGSRLAPIYIRPADARLPGHKASTAMNRQEKGAAHA